MGLRRELRLAKMHWQSSRSQSLASLQRKLAITLSFHNQSESAFRSKHPFGISAIASDGAGHRTIAITNRNPPSDVGARLQGKVSMKPPRSLVKLCTAKQVVRIYIGGLVLLWPLETERRNGGEGIADGAQTGKRTKENKENHREFWQQDRQTPERQRE